MWTLGRPTHLVHDHYEWELCFVQDAEKRADDQEIKKVAQA